MQEKPVKNNLNKYQLGGSQKGVFTVPLYLGRGI
jgi:hypothetical protein